MANCRRKRGFTLIELMIIAAIIAILAMIALPKFANMIRKSKEAAIRGDLGALRSALNIYCVDNEGYYPALAGLNWSLIPKYFSLDRNGDDLGMPRIFLPGYVHNNFGVDHYGGYGGAAFSDTPLDTAPPWGMWDRSRWYYVRFNDDPVYHPPVLMMIGCTHTDVKGIPWTVY